MSQVALAQSYDGAVYDPGQHAPGPLAVASPLAMIERAVVSGAGVETIEKLMTLHERFEANKARRAFDAAIAAARAEIKPIVKTAEVDFTTQKGRTNYKHETLDAIAAQIDPILAKHGLSYRFRSTQQNGGLSVTCIVAHRDGYSEETSLFGPPDQSGNKNAYQAIGSAATYLQRYTLKLALGLSAAKDDDGHSAGPKPGMTVSAEEFVALRDLAAEAGVAPERICRDYGARSLDQFPAEHFDNVMARLRTTVEQRAPKPQEEQRGPRRPDPAQMSNLRAEVKRAGLDPQVVAEGMGVAELEDLTLEQWEDALRRVRATLRRREEAEAAARAADTSDRGPGDYDATGY